jgi:hypothetical protein
MLRLRKYEKADLVEDAEIQEVKRAMERFRIGGSGRSRSARRCFEISAGKAERVGVLVRREHHRRQFLAPEQAVL